MNEIVLQPTSDQRPKPEDVRTLGDELSRRLGLPVRVASEPQYEGRRVTWWEVLHLWFPVAEAGKAAAGEVGRFVAGRADDVVVGAAVEVFVDWARARMQRYLDEQKTRRKQNPPPQHLTLYGPDGKAIKTVTVQAIDAEPEIKDPDQTSPDLPVP